MIQVGETYEFAGSKNGPFTFVVVAESEKSENFRWTNGEFSLLLLHGKYVDSFGRVTLPGGRLPVGRNSLIALQSEAVGSDP